MELWIEKMARLVVQGNRRRYGVDYQETFAPIAKMVIIKSLLAVAVVKRWFRCQMDVSNAFLHGDLLKKFYMNPPLGTWQCQPQNVKCRRRKADNGVDENEMRDA
ncbi:cysteine-rich receptor-like protein kinase 8 [Tanacetum coccineum]